MFRIRFGFFLGLMTILFGCQGLFDNKQKTQQTSPPPKTTTPPKETSFTVKGLMNIQDTGSYKFVLAATTGCVASGISVGVGIRCSAWEGQPLVAIAFNSSLDKVKSLTLTPRGSKMGTRNQEGRFITIKPKSQNVFSINDGDGWEVRFLHEQGFQIFELRVRCENCDLKKKEFDDVDIYFGSDLSKILGDVPTFIVQENTTASLIHQNTFADMTLMSKTLNALSFPLGN